jgi:hypothetical protein
MVFDTGMSRLFLLALSAGVQAQSFTARKQCLETGEWLAIDCFSGTWPDSLALANNAIANMSLADKVGIVTGVGELSSQCVGNTHAVPKASVPSICLNDGPAGVRAVKNVTGFPPGINAASTCVKFYPFAFPKANFFAGSAGV